MKSAIAELKLRRSLYGTSAYDSVICFLEAAEKVDKKLALRAIIDSQEPLLSDMEPYDPGMTPEIWREQRALVEALLESLPDKKE